MLSHPPTPVQRALVIHLVGHPEPHLRTTCQPSAVTCVIRDSGGLAVTVIRDTPKGAWRIRFAVD